MIYDTLIIGGGLVGAAMAVALKQQQRRVALLEIRPPTTDAERLEKGWDARIYAISPVNRQFLQSLHAWPSESRIQPVARMDVRGDGGGRIEFAAADIQADRLTSIAENRWLLAALWRQIEVLEIPVFTEAAAIHTDVEAATLTLANGETLKTRLIIGADGANSWVRAQAGITVQENAYGHHGVVANFHTEKATTAPLINGLNTAKCWPICRCRTIKFPSCGAPPRRKNSPRSRPMIWPPPLPRKAKACSAASRRSRPLLPLS